MPCRAVDSTGLKIEGEGEWHARKHGGPKRRVWRKIQLGIYEQILEVRAVEITGSHIGNAPVMPDLLSQISTEEIGSVTANGAYDIRKCHEAIAARNAAAVIPPRKTSSPRSRRAPVPWHATTLCEPLSNWDVQSGDGGAVSPPEPGREPDELHQAARPAHHGPFFFRQVVELQVRIAVPNGYTALGIPVTEPVG